MKIKSAEKVVLKKHAPVLRTLSRAKKAKRNEILSSAPASLFRAIKILHKLLVKGGISLSNSDRAKMTPKTRAIMRKIHATKSKDVKKTILQNGQGFAGVLRVVLPIVRTILGIV